VLYLVGLGLGDEKDITLKGLEVLETADFIYLEHYTSVILSVESSITGNKDALEAFYSDKLGRKITIELADREFIESDEICNQKLIFPAKTQSVALLIVGDPFGATTHADLVLRAKQNHVEVRVVHNASIMTAIGACGLQLYRFGETVSIVQWKNNWKPSSFFDKIRRNLERDLHTLCLLDIKVKEETDESILYNCNAMIGSKNKKKQYLAPTFLTIHEATKQLLELIEECKTQLDSHQQHQSGEVLEDCTGLLDGKKTMAVGLARIGSKNEMIRFGSLEQLKNIDFGPPLHSMVICANILHEIEEKSLAFYSI